MSTMEIHDEEIDFDVPVEIADATSPACKPKIPKDGKHWIYVLPNQECVVYFMESAAPHRFHRHTFSNDPRANPCRLRE